jgi:N-acetylneuraminic acid mutarotase
MKSPINILKTSAHQNNFIIFLLHKKTLAYQHISTLAHLTFLLFLIFYISPLHAQNWVWEKGINANNYPGTYGIQGIANTTNNPGARKSAVTWADTSGNLWLFGGFGYDKNGSMGKMNDLWKYNISTKEWTWMHGQDVVDQPAVYGTKGISNTNNRPGARQDASSLVDADGNLWLMGGDGLATSSTVGCLNDLWKYDIANNSWTWVSGNNNVGTYGFYGTQGIAASYNTPGSRHSNILFWNNNEIWLMGGFGLGLNGANGALNDVWKYNISTGFWTWVKGSQLTNRPGVYGLQGQADPANTPGGRYSSGSWMDNAGNLWIMMGYGYNGNGQYGYLNDVWKYNINTNQWTWTKGGNAVHCAANYGTLGLGYGASTPGARWKPITWVDEYGHFWLFGGYGRAVSAAYGQLNDLWQYNATTNEWIWMSGNNTIDQKATYGTINIPTTSNKPGAKEDAFSWVDGDGNFWLMGGYGFANSSFSGYLNDLWKHVPNQIPAMATPSDTIFCGNTTSFSIPLYIQDLDNDSINFTVSGIDPGILNTTISFTHLGGCNYTLNGVLTGNMGSTTCMLLATDEHGASDFTVFEIGVQANSFSSQNFEICHGDSVYVAGNYQKTTGVYQDILTNSKGCDSIVTSTLVVKPQNISYQIADICDGSGYLFKSTILTMSGLYYDTLQSVNGCDSIIALNLNVLHHASSYHAVSICPSDFYTFDSNILTTSGLYYDTLQSSAGCDSIVILNLMVNPFITTVLYDTIFDSETYLFGNDSLTTEGTYLDTLLDLNGCDSLVMLNLSVVPMLTTTSVLEQNNAASLQVYPNPSNGLVMVAFKINNTPFYELSIIDQLGRIVYKNDDQNLPQTAIQQEIPLDLSNLSNGIYFVRLQTNNNNLVEKIQLVK